MSEQDFDMIKWMKSLNDERISRRNNMAILVSKQKQVISEYISVIAPQMQAKYNSAMNNSHFSGEFELYFGDEK